MADIRVPASLTKNKQGDLRSPIAIIDAARLATWVTFDRLPVSRIHVPAYHTSPHKETQ